MYIVGIRLEHDPENLLHAFEFSTLEEAKQSELVLLQHGLYGKKVVYNLIEEIL